MEIGNSSVNRFINRKEKNKYYINNNKININDQNSRYVKIISRIKPNAKVLDVGCSYGLFGDYLHKYHKCIVHGIECDPESYKICVKNNNYEQIYNFSITDYESEEYKAFFKQNNKYDVIIFSDVLEHLLEPDFVLFSFSKLLKKGGKILVSIPNIAHFDIIYGMCEDRFNYNIKGILDNTHVRFFTKTSFAQMIKETNEYYKINLDLECYDQTIMDCNYLDEQFQKQILSVNKNAFVLQHIFEITVLDKNKIPQKLNKILEEPNNNYLNYLNNRNKELLEELNKIKYSKRCIFINKMANFFIKNKNK